MSAAFFMHPESLWRLREPSGGASFHGTNGSPQADRLRCANGRSSRTAVYAMCSKRLPSGHGDPGQPRLGCQVSHRRVLRRPFMYTPVKIRRDWIKKCSGAAFGVVEISSDTDKCFPLAWTGPRFRSHPVQAAAYPAHRVERA